MFRRLTAFAASALIFLGCTGCGLTKQDPIDVTYETEIPPRMMFLGDSIAAGYGLEGYTGSDLYNCPSYANILHERYVVEFSELGDHEMQNFAVSGSTSADLLKLISSGTLDSALEQSDAVVVSIGGNDLLKYLLKIFEELGISAEEKTFDLDSLDIFGAAGAILGLDSEVDAALEQFEVNLGLIADQLSEKTEGKIYFQTLYDPFANIKKIPKIAEFSDEKIGTLNRIIKDNSYNSYRVIDVSAEFRGRADELTRIGELDIHPNEAGHEVIAELVDRSFRKAGFTYTRQELGEPHLSIWGFIAIGGAVLAAAAVFIGMLKMFKKFE